MQIKKIRIGTRGSKLALWQANAVGQALNKLQADLEFELVTIVTSGDLDQRPIPTGEMGKTWFTEEIDRALTAHEIDIAVHSLKDLSPQEREGFATFPVLERADARDVFVSKSGVSVAALPAGSVIGTDSVRRAAALRALRPDLIVKSVRGNVETRLKKLQDEPYDAVVLAAAGLERLGLLRRITEYLPVERFIPSPGQGVLAAQSLHSNETMNAILQRIVVHDVEDAVRAERAFSATVGGGCKEPVGCLATLSGTAISLIGLLGVDDERATVVKAVSGERGNAVALAQELARTIMAEAGL